MEEKETPRGVLSEHIVDKERRILRNDVELAGELWAVEYKYLSLDEYSTIALSVTEPLERRLVVAEAMAPSLNGEDVDIRDIDPMLGIALAKYLDGELSKPPGKNC